MDVIVAISYEGQNLMKSSRKYLQFPNFRHAVKTSACCSFTTPLKAYVEQTVNKVLPCLLSSKSSIHHFLPTCFLGFRHNRQKKRIASDRKLFTTIYTSISERVQFQYSFATTYRRNPSHRSVPWIDPWGETLRQDYLQYTPGYGQFHRNNQPANDLYSKFLLCQHRPIIEIQLSVDR